MIIIKYEHRIGKNKHFIISIKNINQILKINSNFKLISIEFYSVDINVFIISLF